jgi:hypothetical protein
MRIVRGLICFAMMMCAAGLSFSQGLQPENVFYRFAAFGGAGLTNQPNDEAHASIHIGGDLEILPVFDFKHFPGGFIFEFGYSGPTNHFDSGSALISLNYAGELLASRRKRLAPFFTAGYTRLFGTGAAANFGGGVDFFRKDFQRAIRFEVRDYFRIASFKEHSAAFRVGYVFCAPDD